MIKWRTLFNIKFQQKELDSGLDFDWVILQHGYKLIPCGSLVEVYLPAAQ